MRQILIKAVMNGYVVKAGCQTLVFQSANALLVELGSYLQDPSATEERYLKQYPMQTEDGPAAPTPEYIPDNRPELSWNAAQTNPVPTPMNARYQGRQ